MLQVKLFNIKTCVNQKKGEQHVAVVRFVGPTQIFKMPCLIKIVDSC